MRWELDPFNAWVRRERGAGARFGFGPSFDEPDLSLSLLCSSDRLYVSGIVWIVGVGGTEVRGVGNLALLGLKRSN